jgi:hypothetical protein
VCFDVDDEDKFFHFSDGVCLEIPWLWSLVIFMKLAGKSQFAKLTSSMMNDVSK